MNGAHNKRLLHVVAKTAVVRRGVRSVDRLARDAGRLWGFFRARALLDLQPDSAVHWSVEIKYPENIECRGVLTVGPGCTLGAKGGICFGAYVRLSKGVCVETASLDLNSELPYRHIAKPIVIEDGVWIGANANVLAGVCIGANAVIGAGAVVKKDVPPGAIVVGPSNRLIERKLNYQE